MDNKNVPLTPEFKEFTFDIKCNPCGFQQKVPISDLNQQAAKSNAEQTFLITHRCPKPGQRTVSDFSVT